MKKIISIVLISLIFSTPVIADVFVFRQSIGGVQASGNLSDIVDNNNAGNDGNTEEETDVACYDSSSVGTVGNGTGCNGMLIVDRAMLDSAISNGSYSIEYEGTNYTFADSEHNIFTGQVTNMDNLFYHGGYSNTYFNQDISYWDTSNVTSMNRMFYYVSGFNQNIGKWDVSSVVDLGGMFQKAIDFNSPLNNWDVSSVTSIWQMFRGATSFNQSLNSWNVSNIENMKGVFAQATNFNGNITSWDVSNVTTMDSMFENAISFSQPIGSWDVSNISSTGLSYMFNNNSTFNQDLSCWSVENINSTPNSFDRNATSFENVNKPQWGTTGCY